MSLYEAEPREARTMQEMIVNHTEKREREAAEWLQDQICDMLKDQPQYDEGLHLLFAAYRKMRAEKET